VTRLAPNGLELEGDVEPLEGDRPQLDGIVRINFWRAGVGLPPTSMNADLTAACTAHAKYLAMHRWTPAQNPHFEAKRARGYSDEGHRAAMSSVISWSNHAVGVDGHWVTYYHRFAFLHPVLKGVGLNAGTPSISVIDAKRGTEWGKGPPVGWKDPILVPADGATLVPSGFHRGGEVPAPCERAGSRGYPLTVLFLAPRPGVTGFAGELVRIRRNGKVKPVATVVPRSRSSRRRFGLIPERPLASGRYRVTYTFLRNGERETVTATFDVG